MYTTVYLDERVAITPAEFNDIRASEELLQKLHTKLRERYEGKCNANGFVRPGSIEILAKSMGIAENGRFTGNILYDCRFKCEILYPIAGTVYNAIVIKVNKMGAYAVFDDAIRLLLPRDLHIGNTAFDAIAEGDSVQVRLERSRFQTNDTFIMAVGVLSSQTAVVGAPVAVASDAEEAIVAENSDA
jgi:DNA-directed RNA polymerase subunit E'/Rpb7